MKTHIAITTEYEDCCLIWVQVHSYYSLLQETDCVFQLKQVVSEHNCPLRFLLQTWDLYHGWDPDENLGLGHC